MLSKVNGKNIDYSVPVQSSNIEWNWNPLLQTHSEIIWLPTVISVHFCCPQLPLFVEQSEVYNWFYFTNLYLIIYIYSSNGWITIVTKTIIIDVHCLIIFIAG